MRCSEVQQGIQDTSVSEDASEIAVFNKELQQHLGSCDLCRHFYSDYLLGKRLTALQAPVASADFIDNCISHAIRENNRPAKSVTRYRAVAAALVFGILIGALSVLNLTDHRISGETGTDNAGQPITLAANEIHSVNVLIDSDVHLSEATITVTLTDNLAIDGYPDTRQLSWQTELLKGKNLLTLPLIMRPQAIQSQQEGFMEISYTSNGSVHSIRVNVSATGALSNA